MFCGLVIFIKNFDPINTRRRQASKIIDFAVRSWWSNLCIKSRKPWLSISISHLRPFYTWSSFSKISRFHQHQESWAPEITMFCSKVMMIKTLILSKTQGLGHQPLSISHLLQQGLFSSWSVLFHLGCFWFR